MFLLMIIITVCNVTITAKDILTRSGKSFGEIKSSPGMKGPIFCWFRYKLCLLPFQSLYFLPYSDFCLHLHREENFTSTGYSGLGDMIAVGKGKKEKIENYPKLS
jgi:hypothetical protein